MEFIRSPIEDTGQGARHKAIATDQKGHRLVPKGPVNQKAEDKVDSEVNQLVEPEHSDRGQAVGGNGRTDEDQNAPEKQRQMKAGKG